MRVSEKQLATIIRRVILENDLVENNQKKMMRESSLHEGFFDKIAGVFGGPSARPTMKKFKGLVDGLISAMNKSSITGAAEGKPNVGVKRTFLQKDRKTAAKTEDSADYANVEINMEPAVPHTLFRVEILLDMENSEVDANYFMGNQAVDLLGVNNFKDLNNAARGKKGEKLVQALIDTFNAAQDRSPLGKGK